MPSLPQRSYKIVCGGALRHAPSGCAVGNAAHVIASLHTGEKRLVFCDSRQLVEELGAALREKGERTFLSHASLSAEERHRSEQAFAEALDCVIVSTSTLELGIDVGDLDRVIQVNCPRTVAAFLQRLGRTGRRAGSTRNCLFLAIDEQSLAWTAALLLLWTRPYVEPVVAPPEPRHIVAQQLLAVCLQEHHIGSHLWVDELNGLAPSRPQRRTNPSLPDQQRLHRPGRRDAACPTSTSAPWRA